MILLQFICILAAAFDVNAGKHEHQRNLSKKEEAESHLPTSLPTGAPTLTPKLELYRHSPEPPGQNLDEFCDKKNINDLDICIEWLASKTPSVAPSATPSIAETTKSILSSTVATSSRIPTLQYDPEKLNDHYSTTQLSNIVLIELGHFDMSITVYSNIKRSRKSNEDSENDNGRSDNSRQYEYLAVREHLHEVYTKYFLNPLITLNLTCIDAGEANISGSITRSSIFFGTISLERIEGFPDPTPSELEAVTIGAFTGDGKEVFLDKFYRYHTTFDADASYDVIVEKLAPLPDVDFSTDGIEGVDVRGVEKTNMVLPIAGILAGTIIISGIGLGYVVHNKRKRKHDQPKSSSPIHQILQRNKDHGGFESDDDIVGFDGNNIIDAYMDSASIASKSVAESVMNLNFKEENLDNLLGGDVEILLPEEY